jgi:type VI secretion system protein ImpK
MSRPIDSSALDIDEVLHDTYLLVVQLRQGASLNTSPGLWRHCTERVEQCRERLTEAGMALRSIELIGLAQCALLDETVLSRATDYAHGAWAARPLQAHFFNHHQAGVQVYEDLRELLAETAPDPQVLTCFHRVLMLGFLGRYRGENTEERERLLAALDAKVAPPGAQRRLPLLALPPGRDVMAGLGRHSLIAHLLTAGLVLAATWWGLHAWLGNELARWLPGAGG